jgi:hypothetical protein
MHESPDHRRFVLMLGLLSDGEQVEVFYTETNLECLARVMQLLLADLRAQIPTDPTALLRWRQRYTNLSVMANTCQELTAEPDNRVG